VTRILNNKKASNKKDGRINNECAKDNYRGERRTDG